MNLAIRDYAGRIPNIIGLWEQLGSSDLTVSQFRCVVVRSRNAECRRCAQACTTGCIRVEGGVLDLDPVRCIGCGTCATACPAGAIAPALPDDDQLLAACEAASTAAGGVAVIACEEALGRVRGEIASDKVVGVNCLGRVDETLAVQLAGWGAREVVLMHGDCAACSKVCGLTMARNVAATANLLLCAWGSPARVRLGDGLPPHVRVEAAHTDAPCANELPFATLKDALKASVAQSEVAVPHAGIVGDEALPGEHVEGATDGRRHRRPSRRFAEAVAPPPSEVVKVGDNGTLPHFIPPRRRKLLDALAHMGEPADVPLRTRLWGRVEIDTQSCESCRMCAVFCPTGALFRFDDADGAFGVSHVPGLCVQCRTCESICPAHALRVDDEVRTSYLVPGIVERIPMKPVACEKRGAHSAVNSIRHLINSPYVYER